MGVKERKARQFAQREDDILSAALELFGGDDWQSVTIDQIARAAEVAKGTIYLHFETKEEISARLALRVHRRILSRLEALPVDAPPLERLAEAARVFWEEHTGLPTEYRRVVQYCEQEGFVVRLPLRTRQQLLETGAGLTVRIHDILRAGVADGTLRDEPLPLLLFKAQSAVFGGIRQAWTGCIPRGEEALYFEGILEFLKSGLAASAH